MKNTGTNIIIGIFAIAICGLIFYIGNKDLTANEATLLSILLTLISIIATWIASSYYAKSTHKEAIEEVRKENSEKLRTYALNAAEKVDNLSNELTKLSLYLQDEIDKEDENEEYSLLSKIERINSAIHISNTLKSVNDTSLSDWKGVIGEELKEREEEKEEREERLIELTEKIEDVLNLQSKTDYSESDELNEIKKKLNRLTHTISIPITRAQKQSSKPPKEKVAIPCQNCEATLKYDQRKNPKSFKVVKCSTCSSKYLARYEVDKEFYIVKEEIEKVQFKCPSCNSELNHDLSNLPYSKHVLTCVNCNNGIKLTRHTNNSVKANNTNLHVRKKTEINEEVLTQIINSLPPQPWPTGIHQEVAKSLGYSSNFVHKCINHLIEGGRLMPQYNGVIYKPVESKNDNGEEKKPADNK